jgi:hypothetical protein
MGDAVDPLPTIQVEAVSASPNGFHSGQRIPGDMRFQEGRTGA